MNKNNYVLHCFKSEIISNTLHKILCLFTKNRFDVLNYKIKSYSLMRNIF